MRIAVTGASGQVSLEVQALAGDDLAIIALPSAECDLARPETIAPALAAAKPDAIINAGAYTAVDLAESEEPRAHAINADGARTVAETAKALGVPLIHLSTDYVFAGDKNTPYLESDATGPRTAYGRTKLAGEHAIAEAQPDHAILRLSWIYSPHGKNFVKTMLRLAETRDELGVVSDQLGRPTSARECAEASILAARALIADRTDTNLRGVFHVCPEGEANWAAFAEAIFAASHARGGPSARVKPILTADYPTPAARPANSRLDGGKFVRAFGWKPNPWRTSLSVCLDQLIGPVQSDHP